jgi:hypothetical protein
MGAHCLSGLESGLGISCRQVIGFIKKFIGNSGFPLSDGRRWITGGGRKKLPQEVMQS